MFVTKNYEVKIFISSGYPSLNKSPLGRTFNNVVRAINEEKSLPKLIVMVTDNDLIKYIRSSVGHHLLKKQIDRSYNWLATQIDRAILSYKDYVSEKSKRHYIPHILWILPPSHIHFDQMDNMKREYAAEAIQTLSAMRSNTSALQMLKIWDAQDASLFLRDNYRFTSQGIKNYWLSIDSAIRCWCIAIAHKYINPKKPGKKGPTKFTRNFVHVPQNRRKLPTPPYQTL